MPWTPEDAIERARDYHPAFSDRQTPNDVALRKVDSYDEELYQAVVERESDRVVSTEEISLPLSDFAAGYDLPDFMEHRAGEVFYEEGDYSEPLRIVPHRNRHHPGASHPAYIINGKLHLVGEKEDWDHLSKIEFYYVPIRTPLASLTTESTLPRVVLPAVEERLALFMAQRGPDGSGKAPVPISLNREDWMRTHRRVLGTIANSRRSDTGYVREAW